MCPLMPALASFIQVLREIDGKRVTLRRRFSLLRLRGWLGPLQRLSFLTVYRRYGGTMWGNYGFTVVVYYGFTVHKTINRRKKNGIN